VNTVVAPVKWIHYLFIITL